jgi:hypothetical protein
VRARDGSFYLAFLSDRDGNDDIYVMRSLDARSWGTPVRVTHDANPDWYPHLIQTADGAFQVVWMRANVAAPSLRTIMSNRSDDGLTWDAANEVMVTDGTADDWAPTVIQVPTGDLLAYYSRGVDLWYSRSTSLGVTWDPAAPLTTASSATEIDIFPQVAVRGPGDLAMVWVQLASGSYLDPTTDLYYATSADGVDWSNVTAITSDDASGYVDSLPNLYFDGAAWQVLWTSTATNANGAILQLPLAQYASYPAGRIDASAAHGMNGYSAVAAPTDTMNQFLGVWVSGAGGSNRLYWQIFSH